MSLNVVVFPQKTQHGIEFRVFCRLSKNRRLRNVGELLSKQTFATDEVWRQSGRLTKLMCLNVVVSSCLQRARWRQLLPESDWRLM
jgi:hypothetical protein